MINEINIVCRDDRKFRFDFYDILTYDLDFRGDIIRIDFRDGAFVEFQKNNVICVEVNKNIE